MNERIIRAAVMQVIDDHRYRLYEGTTDSSQRSSNGGVTVAYANAQRLEFANAVIFRMRDLLPEKTETEQSHSGLNCGAPLMGKSCNERGIEEGACLNCRAWRYMKLGEQVIPGVQRGAENPRDHWEEDPEFPSRDWRDEAASNLTRLGYNEWLEHKREEVILDAADPAQHKRVVTMAIPGIGNVVTKEGLQEIAGGLAAQSHLTAAEAWGTVEIDKAFLEDCPQCQKRLEEAKRATGLANEATKAGPPNGEAFNATAAAILAASMIKPAEAAAAHRRAAEAYRPHTTPEEMDSALEHLQELGLISQEAQEAETEQQSRQTS